MADTPELDKQIDDASEAVRQSLLRMGELQEKFLAATASATADFYREAGQRGVAQHPERAKELGAEGKLAEIKAEVEGLAARSPSLTTQYLVEERGSDFWPHTLSEQELEEQLRSQDLQPTKWGHSDAYSRSGAPAVRDFVNRLFGLVGAVLGQYGLAPSDIQRKQVVTEESAPSYQAFQPQWSEAMLGSIASYGQELAAVGAALATRRKASGERESAQAKGLWDEA